MASLQPHPASFRDEAGFMFLDGTTFKRAVTGRGAADYRHYIDSGLHQELLRDGLVLDHSEDNAPAGAIDIERVLVPEQLGFLSYPYEWSFDELKDAALLTLEVAARAIERGMTLKDASAFNVQFRGPRPVFIDTLSFERDTGQPWAAYEQFCRHFLGPLYAMRYISQDAARYLRTDLDGFPLARISRRLPARSYLRPGCLLHIHLHARASAARPLAGGGPVRGPSGGSLPLVRSLQRTVSSLKAPRDASAWSGYYEESRFYSLEASVSKQELARQLIAHARPRLVFDLGSNTGLFASMAGAGGADCVAFDSDASCVNRMYRRERATAGSRVLPLVMDVVNPSPALGLGLKGTLGLFDRPQADLVLALALMHHLRVTANVPLRRMAELLARLGRWLLIEHVPRTDEAVGVLTRRQDSFADYTLSGFLDAFNPLYHLRRRAPLAGSWRELFLFERRP